MIRKPSCVQARIADKVCWFASKNPVNLSSAPRTSRWVKNGRFDVVPSFQIALQFLNINVLKIEIYVEIAEYYQISTNPIAVTPHKAFEFCRKIPNCFLLVWMIVYVNQNNIGSHIIFTIMEHGQFDFFVRIWQVIWPSIMSDEFNRSTRFTCQMRFANEAQLDDKWSFKINFESFCSFIFILLVHERHFLSGFWWHILREIQAPFDWTSAHVGLNGIPTRR